VAARLSPDNHTLVITTSAGQVRVWDFVNRPYPEAVQEFPIAFRPLPFLDDARLIVLGAQGDARWINTLEGRVYGELLGPTTGTVAAVGTHPDGQGIWVFNDEGEVHAWRLADVGAPDFICSHGSEVGSVRFSADGRHLATVGWDGEVRVWNLQGSRITAGPRLRHGDRGWQARFSPDGSVLATTGWDPRVKLWDPRTGVLLRVLEHKFGVWWIDFTADGSRLLTAGGAGDLAPDRFGTVRAWDHRTGKLLFETGHHHLAWEPSLNSNGTRWVVLGRNQLSTSAAAFLQVIDTRSGADVFPPCPIPSLGNARSDGLSTDFDPHGLWIATGGTGCAVVWEAATGNVRWILPQPGWVRAVRFHPDGRRLLTASEDGTARVWDLTTGQPCAGFDVLRHRPGTLNAIYEGSGIKAARFSPDGRWIATSAADHTARLWDANTGLPVSEPLRHGGPVVDVQFSPDGRWLATASVDHTARVWRLSPAILPIPAWLPDFLDALTQRRLTQDDQIEPVPAESMSEVRARANADPPRGVWAEVLDRYLREPSI
jgi:WD40 repeat protein